MLEFCTIIKFEYTSGNERVYFAPSSGFPPTLTSTPFSRPSRDHLATDSVWSNLLPLSLIPSPVSLAERSDYVAPDGLLDQGRVQKANVVLGASTT